MHGPMGVFSLGVKSSPTIYRMDLDRKEQGGALRHISRTKAIRCELLWLCIATTERSSTNCVTDCMCTCAPHKFQVNAHSDALLTEDVACWDHLLSHQLFLTMSCLATPSGESINDIH